MKTSSKYGKDFTLMVVGQIVSLFGNAILRFSLPLYLLRETGSSALFGIVTASSLLPMIVLSLLGGVLADRVNKRNIMVCLDFITAIIVTVFYLIMGIIPIIPLFTVMLMLLYGISGTYQPAVQASIPALVSKEKILSANAIVNQVGSLANFIGPIIGGMLYGVWGISSILKASIICFVLSAIMELFIAIPFYKQLKQDKIADIIKGDLQKSWRFLKYEKPVFFQICLVIAGLNLLLSAMITIGIPVMIVEKLSLTDQMMGITQGLLAIGGLIGGLLTVVLQKKLQVEKSFIFLFLCSAFAGIMGVGMIPESLPYLKYVILSGTGLAITISSTMFSIQMLAVVQAKTPEHLIGKVIACIMTLIMCVQPVGQLTYGLLFEVFSANIWLVILGTAGLSFLIALYSRKIVAQLKEEYTNE